jgi:hypothetical protein
MRKSTSPYAIFRSISHLRVEDSTIESPIYVQNVWFRLNWLFVSLDNAKCKAAAAAAARNYAGGYQGPLVDFPRPSLGTAQVLARVHASEAALLGRSRHSGHLEFSLELANSSSIVLGTRELKGRPVDHFRYANLSVLIRVAVRDAGVGRKARNFFLSLRIKKILPI